MTRKIKGNEGLSSVDDVFRVVEVELKRNPIVEIIQHPNPKSNKLWDCENVGMHDFFPYGWSQQDKKYLLKRSLSNARIHPHDSLHRRDLYGPLQTGGEVACLNFIEKKKGGSEIEGVGFWICLDGKLTTKGEEVGKLEIYGADNERRVSSWLVREMMGNNYVITDSEINVPVLITSSRGITGESFTPFLFLCTNYYRTNPSSAFSEYRQQNKLLTPKRLREDVRKTIKAASSYYRVWKSPEFKEIVKIHARVSSDIENLARCRYAESDDEINEKLNEVKKNLLILGEEVTEDFTEDFRKRA